MTSQKQQNAVVFGEKDPEDPAQWGASKKALVLLQVSILVFVSGAGAAFFAPAEPMAILRFGINEATADTGVAIFVIGFAFGPLFWGPMSEMYGRRLPYIISWPLFAAFCAPSAFVNNIAVIIIFRFLAGCCAACSSNNCVGIVADMYTTKDVRARSLAMAWLAIAIGAGPCVCLPIAFFIAARAGPQDWVLRVYFILVAALVPVSFLLPETHGPTILAKRLRRAGNASVDVHIGDDAITQKNVRNVVRAHILRPASMLLFEPLIQGSAAWISLASALIYLFFEVYPIVFFQQHDFPLELSGLPFFSLAVGAVIAILTMPLLIKYVIMRPFPAFLKAFDVPPEAPEAQLKLSLVACVLMPISLFWFAWTSGPETHWIVPTLSGIPFSVAFLWIALSFATYNSLTYTVYTNSAIAVSFFSRSLGCAALALASHKIVSSLGTKWGVSLFGFLSLGLLPIPLIFLRHGATMRGKSRFALEANAIVAATRHNSASTEIIISRKRETKDVGEKSESGVESAINIEEDTRV